MKTQHFLHTILKEEGKSYVTWYERKVNINTCSRLHSGREEQKKKEESEDGRREGLKRTD